MCSSSWKLCADGFPFFGSSLAHLEPELELFEVDDFGNDDSSQHLIISNIKHLPNISQRRPLGPRASRAGWIMLFFLAKLPPESYTRNLLLAARASELKQFDDMVTFTFQKDTSYIHTLHIFFYSPGIGWKKTDMEKLVRLVGTLE